MNDFSWLPNSILKDNSVPTIIYEEEQNQDYSGYFDRKNNLICVVTGDDEYIPATIAHEFMHYTQYARNTLDYSSGTYLSYLFNNFTYEESIAKYFLNIKSEMEALLFEYRIHKTDLNDWWLNKLVKEYK